MQEVVYHTNFEIESTYFWFLARAKIILNVLKKIDSLNLGDSVIDIGCGTGGFAEELAKKYKVTCLDVSQTALDYCKKRGLEDLVHGEVKDFDKGSREIRAAFMLDVIEHIEDDQAVVNDVHDLLEKNGLFITTVPAYQWLWSEHDETHMHFRRYTKSNFKKLFKNAGFEIVHSSYYNSFLFPAVVAKRFLDKMTGTKKDSPVDEVSNGLNSLFLKIFGFERHFLPSPGFPFGLSILLIAKKK